MADIEYFVNGDNAPAGFAGDGVVPEFGIFDVEFLQHKPGVAAFRAGWFCHSVLMACMDVETALMSNLGRGIGL